MFKAALLEKVVAIATDLWNKWSQQSVAMRYCVKNFGKNYLTTGGFLIEIKTIIRYLIIGCYHNFMR